MQQEMRRSGTLRSLNDFFSLRGVASLRCVNPFSSLRATKSRGNLFPSLRATKSRGNPFLILITLLILCFTPCQAAIGFDGIDDYINIATNSSLDITNRFTISAWVYNTASDPNYAPVFAKWNSSGDIGYGLCLAGSAFGGIARTVRVDSYNTTGLGIASTTVTPTNTWIHIAATVNASTTEIYINGSLDASGSTVSLPGINSNSARIGDDSSLTGRKWHGFIDDVRVYNHTLSPTEIQTLYNSRSKRPSGSLANGLIAHYEMDDDAIGEVTAQAKDSSGNLNHGQFIGFDNLVSNGFSTDVPAQIETGASLKFDGINDYLSTSTNIDDSLSSGFTISTWINANTINDDEGIVSNYNGDAAVMTDRDGISIRKLNSNIRVLISDSGGGNYIGRDTSGNEINTATWHHIIASWNGSLNSSAIKIFVDNIQSDNLNVNSGIVNSFDQSGQPFIIGANQFAGSKIYFNGLIDETRIYNKSLSIPEISFLYNGSGIDPGTSNLQALWTFDDNSVLKDSSGNDNHGVGVGGNSLRYSEGVLRR